MKAEGVPRLVSCLTPKTIGSHLSTTIFSAVSAIASMSELYCEAVLNSGILEVMKSVHGTLCKAAIDFIHRLAMNHKQLPFLLKVVETGTISMLVQSMDLYPVEATDILSVTLTKQTTDI